jgi:DNA-directed RNA polymerase specialized sigma24 family protein
MEIPAIAEKLGVSAPTVRATLLRARKKHLLPKGEANR